MTYEIALTTIAAFILAGISWNTLGVWQKWRNGDDASIQWDRVKKNVIIGAVLGIIGYGVLASTQSPDTVARGISTIPDFAIAVVAAFPLIVVADKIFNRKKDE